jgi:hypothetical protein
MPHKTTNCTHHSFDKFSNHSFDRSCGKLYAQCTGANFWRTFGAPVSVPVRCIGALWCATLLATIQLCEGSSTYAKAANVASRQGQALGNAKAPVGRQLWC